MTTEAVIYPFEIEIVFQWKVTMETDQALLLFPQWKKIHFQTGIY